MCCAPSAPMELKGSVIVPQIDQRGTITGKEDAPIWLLSAQDFQDTLYVDNLSRIQTRSSLSRPCDWLSSHFLMTSVSYSHLTSTGTMGGLQSEPVCRTRMTGEVVAILKHNHQSQRRPRGNTARSLVVHGAVRSKHDEYTSTASLIRSRCIGAPMRYSHATTNGEDA
jgi:hypothetical protein